MGDLSINVADRVGVFSDIDLAARLTDTEDHFTERKSKSDRSGWIRSTVAFANSTPIGYPALLFVGVTDDGSITDNGKIEDLMKSYSDSIASNCYPPIYTMPRVFTHNGKSCIAVTVLGSEARPHFAGKSYVRDGTQTKEASEEQFSLLIAQRNSKVRTILEHKGKQIILAITKPYAASARPIVEDCNQFWVVLKSGGTFSEPLSYRSIPLGRIDLSMDYNQQPPQLTLICEE